MHAYKNDTQVYYLYSVLGNFSGQNTFSKIVALIVLEGRIRLEVDNELHGILAKRERERERERWKSHAVNVNKN